MTPGSTGQWDGNLFGQQALSSSLKGRPPSFKSSLKHKLYCGVFKNVSSLLVKHYSHATICRVMQILHVLVDIIFNHCGDRSSLRSRFGSALTLGSLGMNQFPVLADSNFKVTRDAAVFQAFHDDFGGQVRLLFQPSLQPLVVLAVASPTAVLDLHLDFAHNSCRRENGFVVLDSCNL